MKLMSLELAPLNVPLERRLQTFAVLVRVVLFLGLFTCSTFFLIFLLFTPLFWLTWLYAVWYIYDLNQSSRGGRAWNYLRHSKMTRWVRDYFPVRLITTTTGLDPNRNYIFGSHPHGIMGLGVTTNLLTDINGFSERFPGIKTRLLGLKLIFYIPIFREYMMACGACDVSKESIRYLLKGKGTAVIIVVGGVKEIMDAWPGVTRIVLKNRKGFVRMAIENGAYLVPTFTFGENDVYKQALPNPPGSKVREWQRWISVKFSFSPIIFYGRGIFNYTFGILPFRVPLTTVVGSPIPVEKNPTPLQSYVDEIHERYVRDLKNLFDSHKSECGYPDEEIEFVD